MRYLTLILPILFIFACAHQGKVPEVTSYADQVDHPRDYAEQHITVEDLAKDSWEQIDSDPNPQGGFIDIYLVNNDFDADVRYAVVRYIPSRQMVVGYAYMFKNEVYVYESDRVGGYRPADLRDIDIEWWIQMFKEHFFDVEDLKDC